MDTQIFVFTSAELQHVISNSIEQALLKFQKQTTPLLTIDEASQSLKVSIGTIYNYIKSGKLHPIKIDGSVRLEVEDVNKLVKYSRV